MPHGSVPFLGGGGSGGSGGGGTVTKSEIIATGLQAADIGADPAGAATTAQANAIAASDPAGSAATAQAAAEAAIPSVGVLPGTYAPGDSPRAKQQLITSNIIMPAENSRSYPAIVRPYELGRRRCVIRNISPSGAAVSIGFGNRSNASQNGPSSWAWTLNVGQEWVTDWTQAQIYVAPPADGTYVAISVYTELFPEL